MNFSNYYPMGYQPAMYTPSGAVPDNLSQYKNQYQTNSNGLIWVQGESGAKSFIVAPGQTALLMDSEAIRFFLKSSDASGIPLPLRVFEYSEVTSQKNAQSDDMGQFVTRKEFEEKLAALTAGKESVENV